MGCMICQEHETPCQLEWGENTHFCISERHPHEIGSEGKALSINGREKDGVKMEDRDGSRVLLAAAFQL